MINFKKLGKKMGFFTGFFIFSSILFFILKLLNKIPESVKYWHVILGVIIIYLLKLIIKK